MYCPAGFRQNKCEIMKINSYTGTFITLNKYPRVNIVIGIIRVCKSSYVSVCVRVYVCKNVKVQIQFIII